jgi:uncharacterized protein
MSNASAICLDVFLLDLFETIRQEEFVLTIQQYELLRKAVDLGFGLGGWDDLRTICKMLWVKPNPTDNLAKFEEGFANFRRANETELPPPFIPELPPALPTPQLPEQLPQIPPRLLPEPAAQSEHKVPVAAKTFEMPKSARGKKDGFTLSPDQLPLNLEDIVTAWRSLRPLVRQGTAMEFDFDQTLKRIEKDGFWADIAMRPVVTRKAEFLLFVDDNTVMVPYRLALAPIIQAISTHRISRARIYRFTRYPTDLLYSWEKPSQAIPLEHVLSRCHRDYTFALIWSDAGAANRTYQQERIDATLTFLDKLLPLVRQFLWLNPLPPARWAQTSAQAIAVALNGAMVPLGHDSLKGFSALSRSALSALPKVSVAKIRDLSEFPKEGFRGANAK